MVAGLALGGCAKKPEADPQGPELPARRPGRLPRGRDDLGGVPEGQSRHQAREGRALQRALPPEAPGLHRRRHPARRLLHVAVRPLRRHPREEPRQGPHQAPRRGLPQGLLRRRHEPEQPARQVPGHAAPVLHLHHRRVREQEAPRGQRLRAPQDLRRPQGHGPQAQGQGHRRHVMLPNKDTWPTQSCLFSTVAGRMAGDDFIDARQGRQGQVHRQALRRRPHRHRRTSTRTASSRAATPTSATARAPPSSPPARPPSSSTATGASAPTSPTRLPARPSSPPPPRRPTSTSCNFPAIPGEKNPGVVSAIAGIGYGITAAIPAGSAKEKAAVKPHQVPLLPRGPDHPLRAPAPTSPPARASRPKVEPLIAKVPAYYAAIPKTCYVARRRPRSRASTTSSTTASRPSASAPRRPPRSPPTCRRPWTPASPPRSNNCCRPDGTGTASSRPGRGRPWRASGAPSPDSRYAVLITSGGLHGPRQAYAGSTRRRPAYWMMVAAGLHHLPPRHGLPHRPLHRPLVSATTTAARCSAGDEPGASPASRSTPRIFADPLFLERPQEQHLHRPRLGVRPAAPRLRLRLHHLPQDREVARFLAGHPLRAQHHLGHRRRHPLADDLLALRALGEIMNCDLPRRTSTQKLAAALRRPRTASAVTRRPGPQDPRPGRAPRGAGMFTEPGPRAQGPHPRATAPNATRPGPERPHEPLRAQVDARTSSTSPTSPCSPSSSSSSGCRRACT